MKKKLLAVGALLAISVAGCTSTSSPENWETLEDIAAGIREAGGICDDVDSEDGYRGTCGSDAGYYMLSVNTADSPDAVYTQRFAAETNTRETATVTLWGDDWAITCVNHAEANCDAIKAHIGEVEEHIAQPEVESSHSVLEAAGRQACMEALDEANATTDNMPTIAHDPEAEFKLSSAAGHEGSGSMSWTATISTSAGIPWDHRAQCIADVSTTPPTVTYLSADVPGLN